MSIESVGTEFSGARLALVLPNLSGGGTERVFVNLANEFSKRVGRVDFVVSSEKDPRYLSEINEAVNVIFLHRERMSQSVQPLARYFASTEPEIVLSALSHCSLATYIALLMSRRRNSTRFFVRITESVESRKFARKNIWMYASSLALQYVYRKADGVICQTAEMAKEITNKYKLVRSVSVIENPVITEAFDEKSLQPLEKQIPWQGNELPIVVSAGRLTVQKDYKTLILAFANVRKQHKVRLVILGEGVQEEELTSLVSKLGLAQDVWFPGFVSNPLPFFRKAAVFVLTSRWEGLPNVLIQALGCGTPVVSSDCPTGPREILCNGRFGDLVPVGDVEAFSEAVVSVITGARADREMATEHLRRYQAQFIASRYLEFFFAGHGGVTK